MAIVIDRRTQRLKVQIEEEEGLLCVKKRSEKMYDMNMFFC